MLRLKGPEQIDLLDLEITGLLGLLGGIAFLSQISMDFLAFGYGLGFIDRTPIVDGLVDHGFGFVDKCIHLCVF